MSDHPTFALNQAGAKMLRAMIECAEPTKGCHRPILQTVAFGPEGIAATDSHVMAVVPWSLFPVNTVSSGIVDDLPPERRLLNAADLKRALTPNVKRNEVVRVTFLHDRATVQRIDLPSGMRGRDLDSLPLDAATTSVITYFDGQYPNLDGLWPDDLDEDKPNLPGPFNPDNLSRVANVGRLAVAMGNDSNPDKVPVIIQAVSELKPIVVTAKFGAFEHRAGLIMPMRV